MTRATAWVEGDGEPPIVGDDHGRAVERPERRLELLDGLEVEVIGRLVVALAVACPYERRLARARR